MVDRYTTTDLGNIKSKFKPLHKMATATRLKGLTYMDVQHPDPTGDESFCAEKKPFKTIDIVSKTGDVHYNVGL